MISYSATTRDVVITVRPVYLDEASDFIGMQFAFDCYISIENDSPEELQLLRRHWMIREASGEVQDVEGEGVGGQQPVILPGSSHKFSRRCVIRSFDGSIEGTYLMQRPSGARFRALSPSLPLHAAAN